MQPLLVWYRQGPGLLRRRELGGIQILAKDGKPEMTVRDAAGKVTPARLRQRAGAQLHSRHRLQGDDIWVATAKGLSHGIRSNNSDGDPTRIDIQTKKINRNKRSFTMIRNRGNLETIATGPIEKRAMTNLGVLNEAYHYAKPSSFPRGMRIDLYGLTIRIISGTASIDENGVSVHIGDFPAQLKRTFENITGLLESEGATWKDVVKTSCYPARHRSRLRRLQLTANCLLQGTGP